MRTAQMLLLILLSATCTFGQTPDLTPAQVHTVLDSLCSRLKQAYIFPDTAVKMAQYLQAQYKKGAYADYRDPRRLATRLAADLQAAHHDDHLRLTYQPSRPGSQRTDTTGEAQREKDEN